MAGQARVIQMPIKVNETLFTKLEEKVEGLPRLTFEDCGGNHAVAWPALLRMLRSIHSAGYAITYYSQEERFHVAGLRCLYDHTCR